MLAGERLSADPGNAWSDNDRHGLRGLRPTHNPNIPAHAEAATGPEPGVASPPKPATPQPTPLP
jgi:hypothetical protein